MKQIDEAMPMHPGSDLWLEYGRTPSHATELMASFAEADSPATGQAPFWVPISGRDRQPLGWLRFDYVTTIKNQPVFAANAWRSADDPAPPSSELLLPLAGPFPAIV